MSHTNAQTLTAVLWLCCNNNRQRLQEVTAKHSAEQQVAEQRLEEADRRITELKQTEDSSSISNSGRAAERRLSALLTEAQAGREGAAAAAQLATARADTAEQRCAALAEAAAAAERSASLRASEVAVLEQRLADLRALQAGEGEALVDSLQRRLAQAETLLGQTEAHSQAQAQEVAPLRTAIAQLERELATKDTTLDSLAQERQRLSDAVAQRDADLQALLGQKRGLEGEVTSAQRAAHCGTLEAAVHAQFDSPSSSVVQFAMAQLQFEAVRC
eukprot:20956-Heterococcus_DN1.PRE.2